MHKKSEILLINKYPSLYSLEFIFECGDGWLPLIDVFSSLLISCSENTIIEYVKEECGHLSIQLNGYSDADYFYVFGLSSMAYSLSELICDQCGNRGYIYNCSGIINSRCEVHGGYPIGQSRSEISPHVPFNLNHIGVAWSEIISNLYLHVVFHVRENKMPPVTFNSIETRDGQLVIDFSGGGDEAMQGTVDLLLAYTLLIDEYTGKLLNPLNDVEK